MTQPRAYTEEEIRDQFIRLVRNATKYWADAPGCSTQDRCEGVAFTILSIIDGTTMGMPALNLSVDPHPTDKQFMTDQGENWYEPGTTFNTDVYLHEMFYAR